MSKDVLNIENECLKRAICIAKICYEKRAEDVRILDLRGLCGYADFLVIGSGKNAPQMKGILKDIEKDMKQQKYRLLNEAGRDTGEWVLIDYGDVVVHLFSEQAREFYQLEELWADAVEIDFSKDVRKPVEVE